VSGESTATYRPRRRKRRETTVDQKQVLVDQRPNEEERMHRLELNFASLKLGVTVLIAIASIVLLAETTLHAQHENGSGGFVRTAAGTGAASQVIIDNYAFSPGSLTVKVGTTVTWINQDDDAHTVDSTQGKFKSATLNKGDRFDFRFTAAGEYPFYCSFHPKMTGKIIVQP
jgi:plastocyanin